MYNRYIPQPDGSFKRNRLPEALPPRRPAPPPPEPPQPAPACCEPPVAPKPPSPPKKTEHRPQPKNEGSIPGFLRQLLPKDLDTGDLLVILLLLLMAGDSEEGRNNALLTLALYFFM